MACSIAESNKAVVFVMFIQCGRATFVIAIVLPAECSAQRKTFKDFNLLWGAQKHLVSTETTGNDVIEWLRFQIRMTEMSGVSPIYPSPCKKFCQTLKTGACKSLSFIPRFRASGGGGGLSRSCWMIILESRF